MNSFLKKSRELVRSSRTLVRKIRNKQVRKESQMLESDTNWKLSRIGMQRLVDLTCAKDPEKKRTAANAEVLQNIEEKIRKTILDEADEEKGSIAWWNDIFSGRRELVDCLIDLFIDDDWAKETPEEIQNKIQASHDVDMFNALAIQSFSLHLFLGAYVRSQNNRQEVSWADWMVNVLQHFAGMPLGVMTSTQIATAHVEERCIMWRAQIEQVAKATGSTVGITVFAIPFVGPLAGKIIHYLNEHPALIFIPEGSVAADCSLRGGDAKHRPKTLEQEWEDMERAEAKLKTKLEALHEDWKEIVGSNMEVEENPDSRKKTLKVLMKELDTATEPYKKGAKTRGEMWKEIKARLPKRESGETDYSLAEVRLKERNVLPEWPQTVIWICSLIKSILLLMLLLSHDASDSIFLTTLLVFSIAWVQSILIRRENEAWEERFQFDADVVKRNEDWKLKKREEKSGTKELETFESITI
jgi:hypothetical protein